jgi:hypothetical protein
MARCLAVLKIKPVDENLHVAVRGDGSDCLHAFAADNVTSGNLDHVLLPFAFRRFAVTLGPCDQSKEV